MSAVMTMRDWMHGHHHEERRWMDRMSEGIRHVVHDERFWWVMLAVGLLIAFAVLLGISTVRGVPVEWPMPPTIVYPYAV